MQHIRNAKLPACYVLQVFSSELFIRIKSISIRMLNFKNTIMKTLKFLLVLGMAFLLFSCEKDFVSDSEDLNNQDLMLKSGAPDQPGNNLKVFRSEDISGWALWDAKSNLLAVVGIDPVQWCSDGTGFDILSFQQILKDEGDDFPRIHLLINQDDVTVTIWDSPEVDCEMFSSKEPIYRGTGHLIVTDNDVVPDEQNTNSWGIRFNGEGVNVKYHATFDGETGSILKEKTIVMLK